MAAITIEQIKYDIHIDSMDGSPKTSIWMEENAKGIAGLALEKNDLAEKYKKALLLISQSGGGKDCIFCSGENFHKAICPQLIAEKTLNSNS